MDAFALSLSYGMKRLNNLEIILTAISVGIFHFFMPLLGNILGHSIFEYTILKPKIVLFIIFLILSVDMIIHFFENNEKIRSLNLLGIIIFSFSVSFDSFSVGLGIDYLYNNIFLSSFIFCFVSSIFTLIGFLLGKLISKKVGKYSFLFGGLTLFIYSLWVLTK